MKKLIYIFFNTITLTHFILFLFYLVLVIIIQNGIVAYAAPAAPAAADDWL